MMKNSDLQKAQRIAIHAAKLKKLHAWISNESHPYSLTCTSSNDHDSSRVILNVAREDVLAMVNHNISLLSDEADDIGFQLNK